MTIRKRKKKKNQLQKGFSTKKAESRDIRDSGRSISNRENAHLPQTSARSVALSIVSEPFHKLWNLARNGPDVGRSRQGFGNDPVEKGQVATIRIIIHKHDSITYNARPNSDICHSKKPWCRVICGSITSSSLSYSRRSRLEVTGLQYSKG